MQGQSSPFFILRKNPAPTGRWHDQPWSQWLAEIGLHGLVPGSGDVVGRKHGIWGQVWSHSCRMRLVEVTESVALGRGLPGHGRLADLLPGKKRSGSQVGTDSTECQTLCGDCAWGPGNLRLVSCNPERTENCWRCQRWDNKQLDLRISRTLESERSESDHTAVKVQDCVSFGELYEGKTGLCS